MNNRENFKFIKSKVFISPNIWDFIALLIILGLLAVIAWGATQMATPYRVGEELVISLDPRFLPGYTIKTVLRMLIAMLFSLGITFIVAPLAAKNITAGKLLIPFIDIMQSIPVLGMLSITVVGFIKLFPNSLLGPESASIFAVFTAQAWNIILSFYQSLRTLPTNLQEAASIYQLSSWQRFWRIEVPFGTQGILWNCMMSMSAGWFFVVLSETITVSNQNIALPGIGSYISKAISEQNFTAMWYAIITMLLTILLYDQLLFRPLIAWADKFNIDQDHDDSEITNKSWFLNLLTKTKLLKKIENTFHVFLDFFINKIEIIFYGFNNKPISFFTSERKSISRLIDVAWKVTLTLIILCSAYCLVKFIKQNIAISEVIHVIILGSITALKVFILIILASIVWIPIGVWIGMNKRASNMLQPIIQFLAAFPANFLFPIVCVLIVKYNLNKNIWTAPLMILGTQWYILFNVIAGMNSIPKEIILTTDMLGIKGILWWKKVILPAIFPYYVTGAMTAAGGSWNASIVAEVVKWGNNTINAVGIGHYINQNTTSGDFPRIALGISIMSMYVIIFNKLLWRKLYNLANSRFNFN